MIYKKLPLCTGTRELELASACIAAWWTYLLHLPTSLFATNLAFLGLQHMASERLWMVVTLLACVAQVAGWVTKKFWIRWVGAVFALALWSFVSAGIYAGSPFYHRVPVNTGFGNYSALALFNFWNVMAVYPPYVWSDWQTHRLKGNLRKLQRVKRAEAAL